MYEMWKEEGCGRTKDVDGDGDGDGEQSESWCAEIPATLVCAGSCDLPSHFPAVQPTPRNLTSAPLGNPAEPGLSWVKPLPDKSVKVAASSTQYTVHSTPTGNRYNSSNPHQSLSTFYLLPSTFYLLSSIFDLRSSSLYPLLLARSSVFPSSSEDSIKSNHNYRRPQ